MKFRSSYVSPCLIDLCSHFDSLDHVAGDYEVKIDHFVTVGIKSFVTPACVYTKHNYTHSSCTPLKSTHDYTKHCTNLTKDNFNYTKL